MYFGKKYKFWQGNFLIEFNVKDEKPVSDLHFDFFFLTTGHTNLHL
jgi:hypothetical protein